MKKLYFLVIVFAISMKSNAQSLALTSLKRIDPTIIISSNYTSIPNCSSSNYKSFDSNNPYTYLQSMVDESGVLYQLLYQTNFSDGLEYLSISNNSDCLCFSIKKNEYCSCVNKLHEETFPSIQTSGTLDCAVRILNQCEQQ